MDTLTNLWMGLSVVARPENLLFSFIGCLLGTLIGVLPGIGSLATISLLLPITFYLDPVTALVMLAGIYYGAQYGGSTTSILVNLPGESSSVVTCLDGHQMARQGRAGTALAVAALSSFFAGTVATFVIALFSPPLTEVALAFRSADYFALMLFGLVAAVVMASGSPIKAVCMVLLGMLLGFVGSDVNTGELRFTFGLDHLQDGIGVVAIAMGLFGIGDIISNLASPESPRDTTQNIGSLWPKWGDFKLAWRPAVRGTVLGSLVGVLPGGGAMISSFAAYALEKKISRTPSRFGKGAIEGVAAPESANNASAQTSFIPLLTLGIPGNALIAIFAGAMMIHGITPGPQVIVNQPELFWGLIASMWIGNLMLVVINLPLIGIWVSLLRVPYHYLFPIILVFISIGAYASENTSFDVITAAIFGAVGYLFVKLDCEPAPLILGFILGPLMEENLRRALIISRGDWSVLVERPISLSFLVLSVALTIAIALPNFRKLRKEAFTEE